MRVRENSLAPEMDSKARPLASSALFPVNEEPVCYLLQVADKQR